VAATAAVRAVRAVRKCILVNLLAEVLILEVKGRDCEDRL